MDLDVGRYLELRGWRRLLLEDRTLRWKDPMRSGPADPVFITERAETIQLERDAQLRDYVDVRMPRGTAR